MRNVWFEYRGARYAIRDGETLVGRGGECALQVDDVSVSRQHLLVRRADGVITVTDLGSSNGSFVNGEPLLGSRMLRVGDRIYIGSTELVLGARDDIESAVPPGIEIIEQRVAPAVAQVTTRPEFSTIAVLESLIATRATADDPVQLAWMVRRSLDHFVQGLVNRGIDIGAEQRARIERLLKETRAAALDGSFDAWAAELLARLSK